MGTYLYKYLITLNVLQRKIETVSNSLIIDMQTTNRISKQLSELISMYWCFSCTLFNNCVVLKKIIKNIKYIYNEFKLSKTLKRLLFVFLYIFIIPILIGFVSPGFILLIKRCLFIFYFLIKPKRRMHVFFWRRNYHIKKLIIKNAVDDNSCRYSCG